MKDFLWYGLRLKNIIGNLCTLLGTFLFGSIMFEIVIRLDDEVSSSFPMGTFMCLIILVGIAMFANWQEELQQFSLSVSMGCTRRKFMISYSIQYFILMVIDWVFMFLLYKIEGLRMELMYPELPMESFDVIFKPATFFLVPFVMLAVGLLIGGIGLRFGSNSRWIVMIAWIALCIGASKIGKGSLLIEFLSWPAWAYGVFAAGLSIVFIVIAVLMIRKQRVDI